MTELRIVADENEMPPRCGRPFGADHYTFGAQASAAHMHPRLRDYITPEEYEAAFAMSNELQKQYWTADNNHVYALLLSCCTCIPCIVIHKCFYQIPRRRIGEPFKQWEKNGLKVNFSLGELGARAAPRLPTCFRFFSNVVIST